MITGKLCIQNADYLQPVSAVNIDVNGQTVYITYLDADGKLKSATASIVVDSNGIPAAMSGCAIV
jgi:hypothetical protein